jgi:hypothetical protein
MLSNCYQRVASWEAVVVAICIGYGELEGSVQFSDAKALIFVPRSGNDLRAYMRNAPTTKPISWREENRRNMDPPIRTPELQQKISWYDEHYKVVQLGSTGGENRSVYLPQDGTGRCRYCDKKAPDVAFRTKAHAFPEQIGNKTLVDLAECDDRNKHFGNMLDNDFAKWTQPWRSAFRVIGSSGIPTTKSRDRKMRIEADDISNLRLFVSRIDENRLFDSDDKLLRLKVDRPAYVPMGVFKCMVKMSLAVMPEVYARECGHLKKWILEPTHTFESYRFRPLIVLLQLVPVPMPAGVITYALLRRTNDDDAIPYMIFVLQFSHVQLQIALPMHEQDGAFVDGAPFELVPFPNLGGLVDVETKFGKGRTLVLDMSGVERIKDDIESITLGYEQRIEISKPGP